MCQNHCPQCQKLPHLPVDLDHYPCCWLCNLCCGEVFTYQLHCCDVDTKNFFFWNSLTGTPSSLALVSLGAVSFHSHFLFVFSLLESWLFLSLDSLLDFLLPFLLDLDPLLLPCFNDLISAVMARIYPCSSDGVPQALSSSNNLASYLFSANFMSYSAL